MDASQLLFAGTLTLAPWVPWGQKRSRVALSPNARATSMATLELTAASVPKCSNHGGHHLWCRQWFVINTALCVVGLAIAVSCASSSICPLTQRMAITEVACTARPLLKSFFTVKDIKQRQVSTGPPYCLWPQIMIWWNAGVASWRPSHDASLETMPFESGCRKHPVCWASHSCTQ